MNGKQVSTDVFAPGWTDYSKRVYVQTYDVTSLLQQGKNAIGVILADGWYCGHVAWKGRQMWGDRPKLLVQLEITLTDGTCQTVISDNSWKTTTGTFLQADFLMGEQVDARLDPGAFSSAEYDDSSWLPVIPPQVSPVKLECSPSRMIRRQEELPPAR